MSKNDGRYVWHELMTTDEDGAKAFYTEVVGWKTQLFEGGPAKYTMWVANDQPMGGLMTLPEMAKKAGAPPHWLGHVQVSDVKATIAKAKELGGTLYHTETIPTVGEFGILADPQGAAFSVFCPETEMDLGDERAAGRVSWNELNTTDYEAGFKFYTALFGWKETESMDMGEGLGTYFMYTSANGEHSMGGMSNVAKAQSLPAHWLYYITVDDITSAVKRIENGGGKILNGPMDVPGGGKIAQCQDPQGAMFAVYAEN